MKTLLFLLFSALCALSVSASADLESGFKDPPASARPHTWWHWMNGHVTREGITGDLESMKAVGLGGFQAFHVTDGMPAGPVGYMSDAWWALMDHTVREAERLGLEMCFHNCAGWSSSGGPWITPEFAMQEVVAAERHVRGPMLFQEELKAADPVKGFYRDIAVIAFPSLAGDRDGEPYRLDNWKLKAGYGRMEGYEPDHRMTPAGDVIHPADLYDLTSKLDTEGRLRWEVPAGDWTVIRFGYRPTGRVNKPAPPEGEGLECDKLSVAGADLHWKNSVAKLLELAGPRAGKTFNSVLIDSYEVGHQNWSHTFAREFRERRGYDPVEYLPALTGRIVKDAETTERFLWDIRRTIADLFTENYYGRFATLCHENGLTLSVEPYGRSGNFDDFAIAGAADIPMGEWWSFRKEAWHHWSTKHAASAAHTYGRTIVGAEAFTGIPNRAFEVHPYLTKAQGDYFFCQGVNRYIFHTFVHKPYMHYLPSMTMGPHGGHFNRGNTWWSQSGAWMDYIARSQFLLQQGRFVADLLYFSGEDAPAMPVNRERLDPVPPAGYDYDFANRQILMQLAVKDGRLVLPSGMTYRMLVLPPSRHMRLDVLQQVAGLVKDGAAVFGPKPVRAPGLEGGAQADQKLRRLANTLWGEADDSQGKTGKARIHSGDSLEPVLAAVAWAPDFAFEGGQRAAATQYLGDGIEFIHRRTDDADMYLVANQHHEPKTLDARFRVAGRVPELWHADSGITETAAVFESLDDGRTRVQLDLDPAGSVFVVFRRDADGSRSVVSLEHDGQPTGGPPLTTNELEIHRAMYGALEAGGDQQVDVTAELRRRAASGQLDVVAENALAGDPARGVVKHLVVDYSLGGKRAQRTVREKERLVLGEPGSAPPPCPARLTRAGPDLVLTAREPGDYRINFSDGQSRNVHVPDLPAPRALEGPWQLAFPSGWGALDQVELPRLISWTEHDHPDVRHFSGTATYAIEFDLAQDILSGAYRLWLELGAVQVMAQVEVNGEDLGVLWKEPYTVDVTDAVRMGRNRLEVRLTNLWVNRLIGDAALPDDVEWLNGSTSGRGRAPADIPEWAVRGAPRPSPERKAFATWQHVDAGDPLQPSGLLGPVILRPVRNVRVK